MGMVLDQDVELQLRREECLARARELDMLKEEHSRKVRELRRGFLSLCQRWGVAKEEAEVANDRLMEKLEVALLVEESEASIYQRSSSKWQGEIIQGCLESHCAGRNIRV